jgi:NAD-dependent SIR2 family protein deacetylase
MGKPKPNPSRGAYYCAKCHKHFDDPELKHTHAGVELEICPHCKSPQILTTADGREVNDLDELQRAKTPRPPRRENEDYED